MEFVVENLSPTRKKIAFTLTADDVNVGCLLRRAGLQGVVCAHPMFLLMHLERCRIFHNAIIRIRALRVNRVSFPVRRSRARASCRATAPA